MLNETLLKDYTHSELVNLCLAMSLDIAVLKLVLRDLGWDKNAPLNEYYRKVRESINEI